MWTCVGLVVWCTMFEWCRSDDAVAVRNCKDHGASGNILVVVLKMRRNIGVDTLFVCYWWQSVDRLVNSTEHITKHNNSIQWTSSPLVDQARPYKQTCKRASAAAVNLSITRLLPT